MAITTPWSFFNLFLSVTSLIIIIFIANTCAAATSSSSSSSFFIFGDSSVDPGNNNYINTTAENRANYRPYAQNGFFQSPTGRFSNGRIIVDFFSEYANLPLIPPFLQPSADFVHGVNFASGGAGVLPETNQGLVIDLKTQLAYFEEVRKSLVEKLGDVEGQKLISEAVYFISIGSNDYMGGYLGNPKMQELYPPEQFLMMVTGNLTQAIQELYSKGGRKFGFLSLSPLGCLPALRALNPKGDCLQGAAALAMAHNDALKSVLTSLQHLLKGFKYCISEFYSWILDRIEHPSEYGFKEGASACCGTGPFRGVFTCGGIKNITEYEMCNNADEFVWWDSFHPTERIHEQYAKALWDGAPPSVGPYNLRDLFFSQDTIADIVDHNPDHSAQLIY